MNKWSYSIPADQFGAKPYSQPTQGATPTGRACRGQFNAGGGIEDAKAVVSHRRATLHVEQRCIRRVTDLAGEKADTTGFGASGERRNREADALVADGGIFVIATMFGIYPFLMKLYADGGYRPAVFAVAVAKIIARVNGEIVKRSDHAKGFVTLPKRWVVEERTCSRNGSGGASVSPKIGRNLNRNVLHELGVKSAGAAMQAQCPPVANVSWASTSVSTCRSDARPTSAMRRSISPIARRFENGPR